MKTLLVAVSLAVAAGSAGTAHAQMYRPATTSGAVLGAIAGGLIGGHNGDRWAQGIAIGAVAGAVMGSVVDSQQSVYQTTPPPVVYGHGQPVSTYPGQVVYGQPGQVIVQAPTVPDAPTIYSAPPQVVYVETAPRVIYVEAPPRVVYVQPRPVISLSYGHYSGPRYGPPVYRGPAPRYGYRHDRGPGHRQDRGPGRRH